MNEEYDIGNRRILVLGLGKSGSAAALLAAGRGAVTSATDIRPADELGERVSDLESAGVELHLGSHPEKIFEDADVIVVSPGVPFLPVLSRAQDRGVEVISEVEFAWRFIDAPLTAVTGSNGKSTTTCMIGEMARNSDKACFVGGNLGNPLSLAVGTPAGESGGLVVVELSSFQLELITSLKPRVAVMTNLSEDHLDRYPDYESYIAAKAAIFSFQDKEDHAVIGADDKTVARLAEKGRARIHVAGGGSGEVRRNGNMLLDVTDAGSPVEYSLENFKPAGEHNVHNAVMAVLAARLSGAGPDAVQKGLDSFKGLPHRMEFVAEIEGVRYYNDSKATNVGAAVKAVVGMDSPVILIAGGRDKGGSYEPLREAVSRNTKAVIAVGESADRIMKEFEGATELFRARSLDEAVDKAAGMASDGDAVLLAPACSSFDMFRNFEHRGEAFKESVLRRHNG